MQNSFSVSYATTLPKIGNAPRVTITGDDSQIYHINFYEMVNDGFRLVTSGTCKNNETIACGVRQWYTNWGVKVFNSNNECILTDFFDPHKKVVFIKLDAYALGDTIAWIPYVEVFRKKYNCTVICSTFHNSILVNSYPNILFVKPNTVIDNVYAQYYIGATNEDNHCYSPIRVNQHPLQDVASSILGLDRFEIRPDLTNSLKHFKRQIGEKYVTLSEFGSMDDKQWKAENGWQSVVDVLVDVGYKVVVISKESTKLNNVINKTGDNHLISRMLDIYYADIHMGVSSGLSWLAWALNTHVVMVSDVTPNWHEFSSNITRINANDLTEVTYGVESQTEIETTIKKVVELIDSRYL